jgi:apolipoprotein N-acyltransferase
VEESGTTGQGRGLAAGWQGLIAVFASAALYVLAFPPFDLPEAAYVFAVPVLFWGLFGKPWRHEGILLFAAGWLAWLVLISWLRHCTSVLEMPLAGALGWAITLALSGIMALFWWLWFRIALSVVRRSKDGPVYVRMAAMLAMASLWVVLEWLRGVLFTGFPWLPLSASQWQRPLLLQVASLTGAAAISFALVSFSFGLSFYLHTLWFKRRLSWLKRLSFEFYLALAIVFAAIGFGIHSSGAGFRGSIEGPRLALVQPNVGVTQKWDPAMVRENLDTLKDLSVYASFLGAEVILWPEAPTPLPLKGNDSMRQWVEGLSSDLELDLLVGNVAREGRTDDPDRRWFNAVFYVDHADGVDLDHYYAKRHLVPFGEYVPLGQALPFLEKLVPIEGTFFSGQSARPIGPDDGKLGRVGNLICYEDIFPGLARANTLAGAEWHYVATNNVWFGEEAAAWQHAAHSVLRAVETRRPVIRCGNAGWSGWIDEFGHIRHVMLNDEGSIYFQGVEAFDFRRNRWWSGRLSPYVSNGDWFIAFCAGLGVVGLWFTYRGKHASEGAAL